MPKKESTNWSFKICASGSLDGSDDDKIMCIKYDPCKDLLGRLTSLEDTDVDPFEEIIEDEDSLEDVPELRMDPDNSDEDEDVAIDQVVYKPTQLLAKFLFYKSCHESA